MLHATACPENHAYIVAFDNEAVLHHAVVSWQGFSKVFVTACALIRDAATDGPRDPAVTCLRCLELLYGDD